MNNDLSSCVLTNEGQLIQERTDLFTTLLLFKKICNRSYKELKPLRETVEYLCARAQRISLRNHSKVTALQEIFENCI